MVQALDQYVFVYMAIVELVQQSLTNVPQLPPRMLNFEKAVSTCISIIIYYLLLSLFIIIIIVLLL